jgi:hypothetical protein
MRAHAFGQSLQLTPANVAPILFSFEFDRFCRSTAAARCFGQRIAQSSDGQNTSARCYDSDVVRLCAGVEDENILRLRDGFRDRDGFALLRGAR